MALTKKSNRRRVDAAEVREARAGAFRRYGRAFLNVFLALAVTVGLGFGALQLRLWALTSPSFALKDVNVTGAKRAEAPELLRLAGLTRGQNLFRLDPLALARSMGAHPWVKRVEVTRRFPARVSIDVTEHEPKALLALGDLYVLDAEGEPFKRVSPDDKLDLPILTGPTREEYAADEAGTSLKLREGLAFLERYQLSDAAKGAPLSELRLEADRFVVVTREGVELRLRADGFDDQLSRLQRIRSELKAKGLSAEVIHLDNRARPDWVAVKLSSVPPAEKRRGTAQ